MELRSQKILWLTQFTSFPRRSTSSSFIFPWWKNSSAQLRLVFSIPASPTDVSPYLTSRTLSHLSFLFVRIPNQLSWNLIPQICLILRRTSHFSSITQRTTLKTLPPFTMDACPSTTPFSSRRTSPSMDPNSNIC